MHSSFFPQQHWCCQNVSISNYQIVCHKKFNAQVEEKIFCKRANTLLYKDVISRFSFYERNTIIPKVYVPLGDRFWWYIFHIIFFTIYYRGKFLDMSQEILANMATWWTKNNIHAMYKRRISLIDWFFIIYRPAFCDKKMIESKKTVADIIKRMYSKYV